jgi:hypothetical protein
MCFGQLPVIAHDPTGQWASLRSDMREWFKSLRSGLGYTTMQTGETHYRVYLLGAWREVPDAAVITEPNRYGPAGLRSRSFWRNGAQLYPLLSSGGRHVIPQQITKPLRSRCLQEARSTTDPRLKAFWAEMAYGKGSLTRTRGRRALLHRLPPGAQRPILAVSRNAAEVPEC